MWEGLPEPVFLTLQDVLDLHQEQIELFGGESGVINLESIDSAIHQPKAAFGGKFHLASNHGGIS